LEGVADIIVAKDKVIYCDDTSLLTIATLDDYPEVEDSKEEDFDKYFMSPKYLKIKPFSRVMIVQNIDQDRGIVNGSQGTFLEFKSSSSIIENDIMSIQLDNGVLCDVPKMLFYQQHGDEVFTRIQYPVILAYGLTIHKCQGLTLNNVIINVGKDIFEAGQAYVALSRCRNLNSLYLSGLSDKKLYCDNVAKRFENNSKKYSLH
jgi:ATP-dependent exoDNAse (exonuclease V) alpha subunit